MNNRFLYKPVQGGALLLSFLLQRFLLSFSCCGKTSTFLTTFLIRFLLLASLNPRHGGASVSHPTEFQPGDTATEALGGGKGRKMRQNALSVKNFSLLEQNEAGHRSGVFIGEVQKLVNVN